jgi:hypothetical protein
MMKQSGIFPGIFVTNHFVVRGKITGNLFFTFNVLDYTITNVTVALD